MKVAFICDVLGRQNNGTTIAGLNFINTLKAKGHEVRVICPDESRKGEPDYYVVPTINFGIFNNYVKKNGVTLAKTSSVFIENIIKDADVIHCLLPFGLTKKTVKLAKKYNKPVTVSFHCQAENITSHVFLKNATLFNNLVYKYFYNHVYKYADCVHYPSQFICDTFENATKPTNHYVISNGVNKAFTKRKAEKPEEYKDKIVILFTGRYSKEKSHKILIDAVDKSKYRDKIQLVFAGDGPLKEVLKEYSKKLPNNPNFCFVKRDELIDIINYSTLYVHPAEIEIEAIACLEAIACGTVPIISNSARSATRHFALEENNLFKCNDSNDLARKIDYWIDNPDKREENSKKYLGYSKRFDFDNCMEKMVQMLNDAISIKQEQNEKNKNNRV